MANEQCRIWFDIQPLNVSSDLSRILVFRWQSSPVTDQSEPITVIIYSSSELDCIKSLTKLIRLTEI